MRKVLGRLSGTSVTPTLVVDSQETIVIRLPQRDLVLLGLGRNNDETLPSPFTGQCICSLLRGGSHPFVSHGHEAVAVSIVKRNHAITCIHNREFLSGPIFGNVLACLRCLHLILRHANASIVLLAVQGNDGARLKIGPRRHCIETLQLPVCWQSIRILLRTGSDISISVHRDEAIVGGAVQGNHAISCIDDLKSLLIPLARQVSRSLDRA
mmetsp:Transcript_13078/g.31084  ORF Transcript_13078/g.31084 Transcript_13078/m.31084 type:complete len:211 (+) Transcript_13078:98-730(+)